MHFAPFIHAQQSRAINKTGHLVKGITWSVKHTTHPCIPDVEARRRPRGKTQHQAYQKPRPQTPEHNAMHPFVQLLAVVWTAGAIGCIGTKDSDPIFIASIFSVIAGVGYYIHSST